MIDVRFSSDISRQMCQSASQQKMGQLLLILQPQVDRYTHTYMYMSVHTYMYMYIYIVSIRIYIHVCSCLLWNNFIEAVAKGNFLPIANCTYISIIERPGMAGNKAVNVNS